MRQEPWEKIIIALDVGSEREALALVEQLSGRVGMFKVGLELIYACGPEIAVKIAAAGGRVFFDCKLHDIPNTVAGAARGIAALGVAMFNVHALGGVEMMAAAREAAAAEADRMGRERPCLLGVTILTSIGRQVMNWELGIPGEVPDRVTHLAGLACEAGLDGVVASPAEIGAIRERFGSRLLIVTPGVRPAWAAANDQKRVLSPGAAAALGADYLVIGRPITQPPAGVGGPLEAVQRITEEIDQALNRRKCDV